MSAIPLSQIISGPDSDSELNQQQPIPLSQLSQTTQQNHSLLPIKNPYMLGSEPLGGGSLAGVPSPIASALGGLIRGSQLQMADLIDTQDWHKRNAANASHEDQQRQEALANAQGLAQKNNAAVIAHGRPFRTTGLGRYNACRPERFGNNGTSRWRRVAGCGRVPHPRRRNPPQCRVDGCAGRWSNPRRHRWLA
jgi:hypothetical protein